MCNFSLREHLRPNRSFTSSVIIRWNFAPRRCRIKTVFPEAVAEDVLHFLTISSHKELVNSIRADFI